jgi:hypothetical protein
MLCNALCAGVADRGSVKPTGIGPDQSGAIALKLAPFMQDRGYGLPGIPYLPEVR